MAGAAGAWYGIGSAAAWARQAERRPARRRHWSRRAGGAWRSPEKGQMHRPLTARLSSQPDRGLRSTAHARPLHASPNSGRIYPLPHWVQPRQSSLSSSLRCPPRVAIAGAPTSSLHPPPPLRFYAFDDPSWSVSCPEYCGHLAANSAGSLSAHRTFFPSTSSSSAVPSPASPLPSRSAASDTE